MLDTLARTFSGDENSAADMGDYIRAAERLQAGVGAGRRTVLVVHHSGKATGKGARGSSALLGAVDTMIEVAKNNSRVTVRNSKQKDDGESGTLTLTLKQVRIGAGDDMGSTSCVLEAAAASSDSGATVRSDHVTALLALRGGPPAQTGEWRKRTSDLLQQKLSEHTFEKWRGELVKSGYVAQVGSQTPARYALTPKGESAIDASPVRQPATPTSVSHATTPEGVAVAAGTTAGDGTFGDWFETGSSRPGSQPS